MDDAESPFVDRIDVLGGSNYPAFRYNPSNTSAYQHPALPQSRIVRQPTEVPDTPPSSKPCKATASHDANQEFPGTGSAIEKSQLPPSFRHPPVEAHESLDAPAPFRPSIAEDQVKQAQACRLTSPSLTFTRHQFWRPNHGRQPPTPPRSSLNTSAWIQQLSIQRVASTSPVATSRHTSASPRLQSGIVESSESIRNKTYHSTQGVAEPPGASETQEEVSSVPSSSAAVVVSQPEPQQFYAVVIPLRGSASTVPTAP
ncbi:MAG: hypothetical protein Q9170_006794 [Blastenia crenularia]